MSLFREVQQRFATLFGFEGTRPAAFIKEHLEDAFGDTLHYWVQILIAMGIATLGLVTNSTAAVIGAMLISPLMGPIERLGIGLAAGSSLLTVRAGLRIISSIGVVVTASALLVYVMPFHEPTREVLARTQPTALDLGVAILCGMVACYSTAAKNTGLGAAAAGTAIAISLVPPLCVVGFGIGTWDFSIARGAMLLFITNLAAIVLVATFFFAALGIAEAPVADLEKEVIDNLPQPTQTSRAFLRLRSMVGSRLPRFFRIALPILVFFALLIPLVIGLRKVSRDVRVRSAIHAVLRSSLKDQIVLQREVVLAEDSAAVVLSLVGEPGSLNPLKEEISRELLLRTGIPVELVLREVPDAAAVADKLSELEARQALMALPPASSPALNPIKAEAEHLLQVEGRLWEEVTAALREAWPTDSLPYPERVEILLERQGAIAVRVLTHGEKGLSPDGAEAVGKAMSATLDMPVRIIPTHIPQILFAGDDKTLADQWLDISFQALFACERPEFRLVIREPFAASPARKPTPERLFALGLIERLSERLNPVRLTREPSADGRWHLLIERADATSAPASAPASMPD